MKSIGVAETALGFAISASKNFYQVNEDIHNGGWNEYRSSCVELYDITVGVISAGNLKYACLGVFDSEPPVAENPLRTLKNVILTPIWQVLPTTVCAASVRTLLTRSNAS